MDARMIGNLTREQLFGILETIPVEISFVDENDLVKFWNKHGTRIFRRPASVVGKTVQNCHPKESVGRVNQILSGFKSGKRDSAEFWIDMRGRKVYSVYQILRSAGQRGQLSGHTGSNPGYYRHQKYIGREKAAG